MCFLDLENKGTDASFHDSTPVTDIMEEKDEDQELYGDIEYFGFVENSMHGSYIPCIGKIQAESQIWLMNLTCTLCRYIQLQKVGYKG